MICVNVMQWLTPIYVMPTIVEWISRERVILPRRVSGHGGGRNTGLARTTASTTCKHEYKKNNN